MDLRKDFRAGDQVMVTSGDQKGMKGWVVEVLENRAVVFDLDKLQQVEVLFLHLEFYEEWDSVCLRSLSDVSKPKNEDDRKMKHDPNRKFIGKEVMIVGANHFKACRGVIRDTTWEGEASVELALFNHPRQEKFHLSHLRLVRENSLCEIQNGKKTQYRKRSPPRGTPRLELQRPSLDDI
ncbi:hypothetical protein GALMADRAFT_1147853 [Galerina marginata CBS 339.88]|uniref:KOW domain-containing protein n=1 Tax=Galerina marginata (strain CBS 339.88) TaxID=685588 RepID=A0A067S9H9_GALM3|nr:hypothetical protein GALMADRAFT_1147853 [Galerina marginata CBS 339.88]